jgi:hypothetical protein
LGAVPRVDGIERGEGFKQSGGWIDFGDTEQVEAGIREGANAISEREERTNGAGNPNFREIGSGGFEGRYRQNAITDAPGTDQQAARQTKMAKAFSVRCTGRY